MDDFTRSFSTRQYICERCGNAIYEKQVLKRDIGSDAPVLLRPQVECGRCDREMVLKDGPDEA